MIRKMYWGIGETEYISSYMYMSIRIHLAPELALVYLFM